MSYLTISLVQNIITSSVIFLLLILKARIRSRFLYTDNLFIIGSATLLGLLLVCILRMKSGYALFFMNLAIVIALIISLILFRFYRNPERKSSASRDDILAPADGFVIYIKKINDGEIPFSVKDGVVSKLGELTKVDILKTPCWLVGITMTLFDVHYVRAPVSGKIVHNQRFEGGFVSLKRVEAEKANERSTCVIDNGQIQIGVVQIASKRVRGLRSFIEKGDNVQKGQRIGMITFGSQTDIILPIHFKPNLRIKQWVYGGKTVIAELDSNQ